jgi:hypothetical protein
VCVRWCALHNPTQHTPSHEPAPGWWRSVWPSAQPGTWGAAPGPPGSRLLRTRPAHRHGVLCASAWHAAVALVCVK